MDNKLFNIIGARCNQEDPLYLVPKSLALVSVLSQMDRSKSSGYLCNTRFNIQQDWQCTYINVTVRRVRVTIVAGKSRSITYPECVSVALVTSMRSACAIL